MILNLKGSAKGRIQEIPKISGSGTTEAMCFTVPVYDMKTNKKVGTGSDCLADIVPKKDGSIALVGTTYFNFDSPKSSIVTRGFTTVQPIVTKNPKPISATHITGSVSNSRKNGVIEGTGKYKNLKANVRLSGIVGMGKFKSDNRIDFDCIFVVDPLK